MALPLSGLASDRATTSAPSATEPRQTPAPWQADCGDGTYRNPVLYADYSDPDVVRVGADYWMTASSFSHVPGLPVLHSRDLVNWTLVNHALPQLAPAEHFATPRHGAGVWAPSIRYHAGRFWIFYPDPDFGLFVLTATDPRGRWSEPRCLKAGRGLIDPCPFWDADGRAWFVHGWAKSRAGFCNRITLHEMSPDGTRVLDAGRVIIDGDALPGWHTIEGPKLYWRHGYYYVFAPAGGVAEGYQAVFRSRTLAGPYEHRIVLRQGASPVNGPHQGAWVDTPSGQHWFLHFQELPAYGRVVHLQPLSWRSDDWPVMGSDPAGHGTGEPVLRHAKPTLLPDPPVTPATSDTFAGAALGLQWQWQGNPHPRAAELRRTRPAALRLHAQARPGQGSLWLATHLLLQKFPAPAFVATVTLDFVPAHEGDEAGLVVFGYDYAWIGLRRSGAGNVELVCATCNGAERGGIEDVQEARVWTQRGPVQLRVTVQPGAACRFAYRAVDQDDDFTAMGAGFFATSSKWVGAKFGLFCASAPGTVSEGHADFQDVTVTG